MNKGTRDTATEFVYELPAATVFDRFAVPQVLETPSPSATFTRRVEVFGRRWPSGAVRSFTASISTSTSAVLRNDADPVVAALFDGLKNDKSGSISIEGHTSSEGATEYNRALSERRARAVVADLARRGIAASRLSAVGLGEARPIASNNDENGRAMNRRVEVLCK